MRSPACTLGRVVLGGCTWGLDAPGGFSVAVPAAMPIGARHNSPARATPMTFLIVGDIVHCSSLQTIWCFTSNDASPPPAHAGQPPRAGLPATGGDTSPEEQCPCHRRDPSEVGAPIRIWARCAPSPYLPLPPHQV